jgi:hypothetical protein
MVSYSTASYVAYIQIAYLRNTARIGSRSRDGPMEDWAQFEHLASGPGQCLYK